MYGRLGSQASMYSTAHNWYAYTNRQIMPFLIFVYVCLCHLCYGLTHNFVVVLTTSHTTEDHCGCVLCILTWIRSFFVLSSPHMQRAFWSSGSEGVLQVTPDHKLPYAMQLSSFWPPPLQSLQNNREIMCDRTFACWGSLYCCSNISRLDTNITITTITTNNNNAMWIRFLF